MTGPGFPVREGGEDVNLAPPIVWLSARVSTLPAGVSGPVFVAPRGRFGRDL